ncbi:hypothetical protein K8I28_07905 [bacterium]|nr:hypothetical protein [bacterium]
MRPTLVDGDFVRVVPLKSVEHQLLQCGMLVFRLNPGNQNTVVHRLVGIGDKFLFESGDHSRIVHPFSREHLIGMITHVKRSGIIHPMEIPLLWRIRNWMEALKSRI